MTGAVVAPDQHEAWQRSMSDRAGFWAEAARAIEWFEPPHAVLDSNSVGGARWFAGGRLNTCFNAIDRHVNSGRGTQRALIYDSPVTSSRSTYTFADMQREIALLAGIIRSQGVQTGDRVVIYMPMIPEAVFAMLACARIGAVHSVV